MQRISGSVLIVFVCTALILTACGGGGNSNTSGNTPGSPAPGGTPSPAGGTPSPGGGTGGGGGGAVQPSTEAQLTTEVIASNLQEPWSLAFASDGRLFFTEATGRLRVIAKGALVPQPVLDIRSETPGFEGGLTGMDLDRDFATNGIVYAHYCTAAMHCRVVRILVEGNTGSVDKVLLDYPITNFDHVGGRLKVGQDNLLYLTVGDHRNDASAQNVGSWDGKILRMNLDGTPAAGNPFPQNPYVYSLGHRDPQGIVWDSSGTLYETEHGPVANDEVNIIRAGKNYGWPNCVGSCNNPAYIDPIVNLAPNPPSMPPSGATFYSGSTIPGWSGSLLIAVLGLADNREAHQVRQIMFNGPGGSTVTFQQALFMNKFGRIRDVAEGPDGFVYFATSNYKQGVKPANGDDRIVRVRPR